MQKIFLRAYLCLVIASFVTIAQAQVKIGNQPQSISDGAVLELESDAKGFLPPRIAIADHSQWQLDGSSVDGMVVYNSAATTLDLSEGLVVWQDGRWNSVGASSCDVYFQPVLQGSDSLLLINSCTEDTVVVELSTLSDDKRCYLQELPLDEPTNASNSNTGKGSVRRRLYTNNQFVNVSNIGSQDSGPRPESVVNDFGVRTLNGEYTESNQTAMSISEGTARGEWVEWDAYFYIPMRYPDQNSGKTVIMTELFDNYTNTSYIDCDYLYVSEVAGVYTQQEEDLKLKVDCPTSGAQAGFQFDQGQAGRYVRIKAIHSDLGSGSQVNWYVRLTYEDNTTQEIAVRNFIHNVTDQGITEHAATTKKKLVHDVVNDVWTDNGTQVTVNTSLGNLERIDCNDLQISFNATLSGSTYTIQAPFGGSGVGYQYSIDGCMTYQTSPSFDLSGYEAIEIIPCVKDGSGVTSAISSSTTYTGPRGDWQSDLTGASTGDTSFDDGAGTAGWEIDYSTELINDDFSNPNSDQRWMTQQCDVYASSDGAYFGDFTRASLTYLGGSGGISATYDPFKITTSGGAWNHAAITPIQVGETFSWKPEFGALMIGISNSPNPGNYNSTALDMSFYVQNANGGILYHSSGTTASTYVPMTGVTINDVFSLRYANVTTIEVLRAGVVVATETVSAGPKYVAISGNGARTITASHVGSVPAYQFTRQSNGQYQDSYGNLCDRDDVSALNGVCVASSQQPADTDISVLFQSNYMYLHLYDDMIGDVNVSRELMATSTVGQHYTTAITNFFYYPGLAGDLIDVRMEVLNSSNQVVAEYTWKSDGTGDEQVLGNANINAVDRSVSFTADGGAYTLRLRDLSKRLSGPDAGGHYWRIDNFKFYEGNYSDNASFFHSRNTLVRAQAMRGTGTLTTDAHDVSAYDVVYPLFDIRDRGTPDVGEESFVIEYSFDNGAWQNLVTENGSSNQNDKIQYNDYRFAEGIMTNGASSIRYRIQCTGQGDVNEGYDFYVIAERGMKL